MNLNEVNDNTLAIAFLFFLLLFFFTSIVFSYLMIILYRLGLREKTSLEMVTLEVRLPRDNEIKIDSAEQMFGSFASLKKAEGIFSFLQLDDILAFEIVSNKENIRFFVSTPNRIVDMVEKTIYGYYPNADVRLTEEPNIFTEEGKVAFATLVQSDKPFQPLKSYKELPTDSLSNITSALSKMGDGESASIQYLIRPAIGRWKYEGKNHISSLKKTEADPEKATFKNDPKKLEKIDEKTSKPGFETIIRILVCSVNKELADMHVRNIVASYNQFESDQNKLTESGVFFKGGFMMNFIYKFFLSSLFLGPKCHLFFQLKSWQDCFTFQTKQLRHLI